MTFEWLWWVCAFPSSIPINLKKWILIQTRNCHNICGPSDIHCLHKILKVRKAMVVQPGSSTTTTLGLSWNIVEAGQSPHTHTARLCKCLWKKSNSTSDLSNVTSSSSVKMDSQHSKFYSDKKKRKPLYRWTEKSKISNPWRATILRWTKILTNPKVNMLNQKKWWFVSRCFSFSFWVYFRVNQPFIFQGVTNWTTKKPSYFPLCWLILIMVKDNHHIIG